MAFVKSNPAKSRQKLRLTKVDPANTEMRRISEELAQHYTKALYESVGQVFELNSRTLVLKCAHDCIVDTLTGEKIAPHFIADCTDLCVYLQQRISKPTASASSTVQPASKNNKARSAESGKLPANAPRDISKAHSPKQKVTNKPPQLIADEDTQLSPSAKNSRNEQRVSKTTASASSSVQPGSKERMHENKAAKEHEEDRLPCSVCRQYLPLGEFSKGKRKKLKKAKLKGKPMTIACMKCTMSKSQSKDNESSSEANEWPTKLKYSTGFQVKLFAKNCDTQAKVETNLKGRSEQSGNSHTKEVVNTPKALREGKNELAKVERASKQTKQKVKVAAEQETWADTRWIKVLNTLSHTTHAYVESCRIVLLPDPKSGARHQSTCT